MSIFTVPEKMGDGENVMICRGCGTYIMDAYREQASTERDHYCSLQCWRKHYPLAIRHCKTCGKEFSFQPSQLKHRATLYCSRQCYRADPSKCSTVERTCEQCEGTFKMYKGQLKHNAGRFCNRQCYRDSLGTKE